MNRSTLLLVCACLSCGRGDAERAAAEAPQPASGTFTCDSAQQIGTLPAVLRESSGIAASRSLPDVLWSHNDSGGEPAIYAADATGHLLRRVRIAGAKNVDWEDIAIGACEVGSCLYIADTGRNGGDREGDDVVYVVPEPQRSDTVVTPLRTLTIRFANDTPDIEALYVFDGQIHLVSKGLKAPITVYRVPANGGTAQPLQSLANGPVQLGDQITAAAASGRIIALRSYSTIRLFKVDEGGRLKEIPPAQEPPEIPEVQGEAIELDDAGDRSSLRVLLTSESEETEPAPIHEMICRIH